jgi:hypothetical protein
MERKTEMNTDNILTLVKKSKTPNKKIIKLTEIFEEDNIISVPLCNEGKIKNKCFFKTSEINTNKKVLTEDLGKIFEMAICLLYKTEYDGNYKYSLEEANSIKERICQLKYVFPYNIKHIAKNGNQYDFVSIDEKNIGEKINLSAKTTKKNGKVCPQVIGQPTKKKFCNFFGIDIILNVEQIKEYIMDNIKILLKIYALNTFDCSIVYYNKYKNLLLFIKLKENINWTNYDIKFSHINKNKKWNESSCISINNVTIGEFQVHNNRDCIKFRWAFENILTLFKDNFEIICL